MSENNLNSLVSQHELLKALAASKGNMRKAIIQNANKKLVLTICECVFNLLTGNLAINKSDLDKLTKYKHIFRKLIKKSNLKTKKKLLIQNGGFIQFLVPTVLTGLSEIVSNLITKK